MLANLKSGEVLLRKSAYLVGEVAFVLTLGYRAADAHTLSIFNLRMDMVDDGSSCNGSGPWRHFAYS